MTNPTYKWEQSPHTADLAIAIEASDKSGLFHAAFEGLLGLQGIDKIPPDSKDISAYNLEINVEGIENALVDFLSECIFAIEVEEIVPYEICELSYDGHTLIANMHSRPIRDDERKELGHIKAATYSDLEVVEDDGIYRAKIVFDT
jgi:SHS2 domain-containing protein